MLLMAWSAAFFTAPACEGGMLRESLFPPIGGKQTDIFNGVRAEYSWIKRCQKKSLAILNRRGTLVLFS